MPAGKAKKGKPDKLKDGEAQEIKALNAKCAEACIDSLAQGLFPEPAYSLQCFC
jgi:hypothetical protein